MKQLIIIILISHGCHTYGTIPAHDPIYTIVDAAQEKARIVLMQVNATFNWLDTLYAARERYYLTGIALDYICQQKAKLKEHTEEYNLVKQLESVMQQMHQLNLKKEDFEILQCKAQKYIGLPLFATSCTPRC